MKTNLDLLYYQQGYQVIAGCDEAGRGPIAGPVVAAAVILPKGFSHPLINDSKQVSESQREALYEVITHHALAWAYSVQGVDVITQLNILEASRLAMMTSLKQLNHQFDLVLSDAMTLPMTDVTVVPLIHGDALSQTIAASSILAKVIRDRLMIKLHQQYPHFKFDQHKGYPTAAHLALLHTHGPIAGVHRPTFGPVKRYLQSKIKR